MRALVRRGRSVLILGPRQTGKTTLVGRLEPRLSVSMVRPDTRQIYEKDPSRLTAEVEAIGRGRRPPLVVIDEIQKVPALLDAVQDLIDRRRATFVLTGSSARKLRRGSNVNLLPGRLTAVRLDPLTLDELPGRPLVDVLLYGALPAIAVQQSKKSRESDLESYVTLYLEEEVRAEALVRNLGSFGRFLELAAAESGLAVNFLKLSQEIGVAHTTVQAYYQILEDCLIAERVEPLTASRTRRKLMKAQKYLFFDLGVRRLAAREGVAPPRDAWGRLFEQWVGLELIRRSRLSTSPACIRWWRDPDGPEVDWVIEHRRRLIPIEVKWTDTPSAKDIRHLKVFLSEYRAATDAYLVCRTPRRMKLADHIDAIPWQTVDTLIP